jgi:hypothetical protein
MMRTIYNRSANGIIIQKLEERGVLLDEERRAGQMSTAVLPRPTVPPQETHPRN